MAVTPAGTGQLSLVPGRRRVRHDSVAPLAFGVRLKATVPNVVGASRTATTWPDFSHDGETADMRTMPLPSSRTSMLRRSVTYSAAHQPCGTVARSMVRSENGSRLVSNEAPVDVVWASSL